MWKSVLEMLMSGPYPNISMYHVQPLVMPPPTMQAPTRQTPALQPPAAQPLLCNLLLPDPCYAASDYASPCHPTLQPPTMQPPATHSILGLAGHADLPRELSQFVQSSNKKMIGF